MAGPVVTGSGLATRRVYKGNVFPGFLQEIILRYIICEQYGEVITYQETSRQPIHQEGDSRPGGQAEWHDIRSEDEGPCRR